MDKTIQWSQDEFSSVINEFVCSETLNIQLCILFNEKFTKIEDVFFYQTNICRKCLMGHHTYQNNERKEGLVG